jgi:putative PIN family toxin of toxin-antitoxin system
MTTPRVVFDTNVLISVAVFPGGAPSKCLQKAETKKAQSITCREILNEFREKLIIKFDYTPERADEVIEKIIILSEIVPITGELKVIAADPKDDMVIECAITGKANYIITGDRKHMLSLGHYREIQIISPSDFLALKEFSEE